MTVVKTILSLMLNISDLFRVTIRNVILYNEKKTREKNFLTQEVIAASIIF